MLERFRLRPCRRRKQAHDEHHDCSAGRRSPFFPCSPSPTPTTGWPCAVRRRNDTSCRAVPGLGMPVMKDANRVPDLSTLRRWFRSPWARPRDWTARWNCSRSRPRQHRPPLPRFPALRRSRFLSSARWSAAWPNGWRADGVLSHDRLILSWRTAAPFCRSIAIDRHSPTLGLRTAGRWTKCGKFCPTARCPHSGKPRAATRGLGEEEAGQFGRPRRLHALHP